MSPQVLVTALLVSAASVATATAAAALVRASRRWRATLASAERRIDELAERLARLEAAGGEDERPAPSPARGVRRRPDRGTETATAGPTLIAVPDLARPGAPRRLQAAALGRRFAAVWEMADAGASAEAIARETGQPVGQVELILGLKRRLAAARDGSPPPEPGPGRP